MGMVMHKNTFIIYLMGEIEKLMLDELPAGDHQELFYIGYTQDLINRKLDHIKQGIAEAWLADQGGTHEGK